MRIYSSVSNVIRYLETFKVHNVASGASAIAYQKADGIGDEVLDADVLERVLAAERRGIELYYIADWPIREVYDLTRLRYQLTAACRVLEKGMVLAVTVPFGGIGCNSSPLHSFSDDVQKEDPSRVLQAGFLPAEKELVCWFDPTETFIYSPCTVGDIHAMAMNAQELMLEPLSNTLVAMHLASCAFMNEG